MDCTYRPGWVSGMIFGGLLLATTPAEAAPILYTLTFDASDVVAGATGASGTGSFVYDTVTSPGTMTDLSWDLGSGRTGGVEDTLLAASLPPTDTVGSFIFEIFNSLAAQAIQLPAGSLVPPFPGAGATYPATFCSGMYTTSLCGMSGSIPSYLFYDGTAIYRGYVTAQATPVPEPASLLLLAAAGVGIGATTRGRRRRRSTAMSRN